jgi:hypothetical protein
MTTEADIQLLAGALEELCAGAQRREVA